jgi:tetratricopeptide (TPR) repeat protein
LSELPFATRDAAGGLLFERIARLPPSLCVGRIPIDAALGCRSEILALLALDPVLSGCDVSRALFLDTESTGLAGAGTVAFLVGTCRFVDGAAVLEQLLLRAPGEERALLVRVAELVADADLIVTYNGKSFDWPLLQSRCVMNRLPALPPRPHLDLLHVARRLHRARLGACRLVTLESEVLGFMRGEDIDGAEVPGRYSHYLRSGDGEALRAVIEHNEWDVLAMAALVGLYGEPLDGLHESDLLGLARTYRRAGDLERATLAAEQAVRRGAGPDALRTRGAIAKARGDRDAALRDFESLEAAVDDPAVRLELAKLYEHHVKAPARALAVAARGTGESSEAEARRVARLERKLRRS